MNRMYPDLLNRASAMVNSGVWVRPRWWEAMKLAPPIHVPIVKTPGRIDLPEDKYVKIVLARIPLLQNQPFDEESNDEPIALRFARTMLGQVNSSKKEEDAFQNTYKLFKEEIDNFSQVQKHMFLDQVKAEKPGKGVSKFSKIKGLLLQRADLQMRAEAATKIVEAVNMNNSKPIREDLNLDSLVARLQPQVSAFARQTREDWVFAADNMRLTNTESAASNMVDALEAKDRKKFGSAIQNILPKEEDEKSNLMANSLLASLPKLEHSDTQALTAELIFFEKTGKMNAEQLKKFTSASGSASGSTAASKPAAAAAATPTPVKSGTQKSSPAGHISY